MKLLVLSNVTGSVDRVVDLIQQSSNFVAKESNMTNDAITRAAQDAIASEAYDLVVVVAKDPIGAGMALNKQKELEAAVCGSADDAKLAKDNGANVIVIRDVRSDALNDILVAAGGGASVSNKIKAGIRLPSFGRGKEASEEQDEEDEDDQRPPAPKARKAQAKKEDAEDEKEEEKLEGRSPRKGLIGKLMDALGIV